MPKLLNKISAEPPESLREKVLKPYLFHGVSLQDDGHAEQVAGECPFCNRPKFSVNAATGLCRCWVCGVGSAKGGMNPISFIRHLWQESLAATKDYSGLCAERGLLDPLTPTQWGAARSLIDGEWLLPGYDAKGYVCNVYRWVGRPKRTLYPTPGLPHGMFWPAPPGNAVAIAINEGPWDGMAFWELGNRVKHDGNGSYALTGAPESSVNAGCAVIAVPGCNSFRAEWAEIFAGKDVVLAFDSDHPKLHCRACRRTFSAVTYQDCPQCRAPLVGPPAAPSGFAGVKRVAGLLGRAKSLRYLCWGPDGYAPDLPSGTDVRDVLCRGETWAARVPLLGEILGRLEPVSAGGFAANGRAGGHSGGGVEPLECRSWGECVAAWKIALEWRQTLDDVLSVAFSVCLSTMQKGSQLFLQIIGDAGGGKTEICDGLLVSKNCFALEHLTGFHSGWKDESGEDFSLIARINGKTLITPEGDVLISSPRFLEIMSQQRRIFDGSSKATFKNRKDDMGYADLRTPWIMAGTPALLSANQSRLGDRFLRVMVEQPDEQGKKDILRKVAETALEAVMESSNCAAGSIVSGKKLYARRLTGGYVDYLRENAAALLNRVEITDRAALFDRCAALADFVAHMRAKPDDHRAEEKHETKEMPTRLTEQFIRLACCLAVVLGRFTVDAEIMRRVRKVALDTAKGKTVDWVRTFAMKDKRDRNDGNELSGCGAAELSILFTEGEDRVKNYLRFLKKIKVVKNFKSNGSKEANRWGLTAKVKELWTEVIGDA